MKWFRIMVLTVVISTFILHPLMGCKSPVAQGPSTDFLKTSGVFMPGGYVDFRFSPGIKSLNRLYHATIITYALSPDGFIDDALWPYNRADVGKKWGSSLSGSNHTFVVKHRVTIPNDEALAGKTVRFLVRYSIIIRCASATSSETDTKNSMSIS